MVQYVAFYPEELPVRRALAEALWQQAKELQAVDPSIAFAVRLRAVQAWTGWTQTQMGIELQPILNLSKPVSRASFSHWLVGANLPGGGPQNLFRTVTPVEAFTRLVDRYEHTLPPDALSEVGGKFFDAPGRHEDFAESYATEHARRRIRYSELQRGVEEPTVAMPRQELLRSVQAKALWCCADHTEKRDPVRSFSMRLQAVRELANMQYPDLRVALEPRLGMKEPLTDTTVEHWHECSFPGPDRVERDALLGTYTALADEADRGFMAKKGSDGLTYRQQFARNYDAGIAVRAEKTETLKGRAVKRLQATRAEAQAPYVVERARYAAILERRHAAGLIAADDNPGETLRVALNTGEVGRADYRGRGAHGRRDKTETER